MALIVASCRDTVSPAGEATTFTPLGDRSYSIRVGLIDDDNALTEKFVIEPGGTKVRVGEFTLKFDPDAVCALDSGYGEGVWKNHCEPLGRDIEITAKLFVSGVQSFVEFSPDIRFNPDRDVTVSVMRPEIIGVRLDKKKRQEYDMWYTKRIGNARLFIDESWRDPDLRTRFNTETGRVWRKIQHFSGFVIHVGYCSENPNDLSCAGGGQQ